MVGILVSRLTPLFYNFLANKKEGDLKSDSEKVHITQNVQQGTENEQKNTSQQKDNNSKSEKNNSKNVFPKEVVEEYRKRNEFNRESGSTSNQRK